MLGEGVWYPREALRVSDVVERSKLILKFHLRPRWLGTGHLNHHAADTPNVDLGVIAARGKFGGGPERGVIVQARIESLRVHALRTAEIRQLELPCGVEQDVLALNVTVHHARCVAIFEGHQKLADVLFDIVFSKSSASFEDVRHRAAVHKFHQNINFGLVPVEPNKPNDVWVFQLSHELNLQIQLGYLVWVLELHLFERHHFSSVDIGRFIHSAGAAACKELAPFPPDAVPQG